MPQLDVLGYLKKMLDKYGLKPEQVETLKIISRKPGKRDDAGRMRFMLAWIRHDTPTGIALTRFRIDIP